jgi:putative SOS response-associated peptidase YedK
MREIAIGLPMPALAARLAAEPMAEAWQPQPSLRPGDCCPVAIIHQGRRLLRPARRGFLRPWSTTGPLHNARGEDAPTKATWREAWARRRCLLALSAFVERHAGRRYRFTARDERLLVLAGLWEVVDGQGYFTVVTCPASPSVAEVHPSQRMGLILADTDHGAWLAGGPLPNGLGDEAVIRVEEGGDWLRREPG